MVEAALLEFTGEYDSQRLYYGVNRFIDEWYKGDAWYGDGAELHLDYYNSLVIHPMLTDVLSVMKKHGLERAEFLERQLVRQQRMAAQRVAENWLFRQSDKYVRTLYKYRQSVYVYSGLFAIGTSGKSSFLD